MLYRIARIVLAAAIVGIPCVTAAQEAAAPPPPPQTAAPPPPPAQATPPPPPTTYQPLPPPVDQPPPPAPVTAPPPQDDFTGYTEWANIRVGGGNYGGHLSVSIVNLRWRFLYWSILNIAGGGGANGGNDKFEMGYYGKLGTRIGFPFQFGPRKRHEIRGGVGVSGGIIQQEVYRVWWQEEKMWYCTSHGPFLDIELLYEFHILRRLAVLVGYEGAFVFLEHNDNGYPDDYWMASDLHAGFIGIAI